MVAFPYYYLISVRLRAKVEFNYVHFAFDAQKQKELPAFFILLPCNRKIFTRKRINSVKVLISLLLSRSLRSTSIYDLTALSNCLSFGV